MSSVEELRIRKELEVDVESDLEEEIKDGIYHLALKLHRLYQHQKERTLTQPVSGDDQTETRKKILSEVNINIKMEGGTTIQIKEIKKQARTNNTRRRIPNPDNINVGKKIMGVNPCPSRIKFDWVNTLRSNPALNGDWKNRDSKGQGKGGRIKSTVTSPQREWKW